MNKKDYIKMIMQHAVLPAVYRMACLTNRVDKKLVVFADAHNTSCPVYMRTLAAELKKRGYKVRGFFYDGPGKLELLRRMCSFMKLYTKAGTVVISDNFLPVASCNKRKRTRVIQLWHGCGAYKKFGYDTEDDIPTSYKGNVFRNYDLVTVSSENCVPYFGSAMRAEPGVVRAVGVPATDALLDAKRIERARQRFFEAYPDAVGKRIVLWTPTFRGKADGSDDAVDAPGSEYIERLAKFNDVYLIRHNHPHSDGGLNHKEADKNADDTSADTSADYKPEDKFEPDIYTLLAAADLLITDYSSVCYDFALTGKPVIFFMPDYEEYSAKRGFYMGLDELPGPVVTDEERIVTKVAKVLATGRCEGSLTREEFIKRYMSACDGRSTERVADIIDEWHDK